VKLVHTFLRPFLPSFNHIGAFEYNHFPSAVRQVKSVNKNIPKSTILIYLSFIIMTRFASSSALCLVLLGLSQSDAFSPMMIAPRPSSTQLEISSNFGDPASQLETVNGTVADPPQLVDPSTMTPPETAPPLPFAGEVEVETGSSSTATTTTTTTVEEPPQPEVVEEVKAYEAAPLARVEDSSQTTAPTTAKTLSQRTPAKYNGSAGMTAPSKRQNVVGLTAIIQQQQGLNIHCQTTGDTARELNTEFTHFL
jgi:hypothetical protein